MRFWVDMDNSPHVHVLQPVIAELRRRGHHVSITARDYGHTLQLLSMYGLRARRVGGHAGKNRIKKYVAFIVRSLSLLLFALGKRFDAAFCHGSRSMIPVAKLLGIPLICLSDYEHSALPSVMKSWITLLLIPDVMPVEAVADRRMPTTRISGYPGLKEDLYVHDFVPNPSFLGDLGIDPEKVLILVRPPATMAHYAVRESEMVFREALQRLSRAPDAQILLLPRTPHQAKELKAIARARGYANVIVPDRVYNGPSLIWYSDLVISGGGTMNREAAALGVPVYSIYQGAVGAVDRHLIQTGKLVHVADAEHLERIEVVKSTPRSEVPDFHAGVRTRAFIVENILRIAGRG